MNKRLLILTGPQGSGNHLWSKIFSEDPRVQGWKKLTKDYWVGHGDEPFVEVWKRPQLFSEVTWNHDLYFTSISCPYITEGGPILPKDKPLEIPDYKNFINEANKAGFQTTLAIIGRDKNILQYQQERVRKQITLDTFISVLESVLINYSPEFISTEQLYLYEKTYLKYISKKLNWPINISNEKLKEILSDNSNKKYLNKVDEYWLDQVMANTPNGSKTNPDIHRPSTQ